MDETNTTPANDASAKPTNSGLAKPQNLSPELEAIVGPGPMPRTQVTKQLWVYIKENNLQDPNDKRTINADEKLRKVFGQDSANMFEMTKLVSAHMTPADGGAAPANVTPMPTATDQEDGGSMPMAA